MSNIGLDFGTTYSVVAAPKDAAGGDFTPTAKLLFDEDFSPFYDSIAVRSPNNEVSYGQMARVSMKTKGARVYKAFKMLLDEDNIDTLIERGYERDLLPKDVVKGYISDLLSRYIQRYSPSEKIGNLVIGVPEIWVENSVKQKCYDRLYDIVDSITYSDGSKLAQDVILVSEPTCACSYYVAKYKEQNNGVPFEGHILIIDYGGGTLDIALCRVENPDGKPKVTVLKRSGAGANEEGVIGKAGFAFMEEIVRLTLAANEQPQEIIDAEENKASIYSCMYELEGVFKAISSSGTNSEANKNFREKFKRGPLEQKFSLETPFTVIHFSYEEEYNGRRRTFTDEYTVTYGIIARAFATKIRDVLDEKLEFIIQYMKENNIDFGFNSEGFKVQRIGGFCNFYLVQKEIEKKLIQGAVGKDKRFIGELPTADDRTMAVAYGAALLANEQTSYGFMSQYSLGLPARIQKKEIIAWAIKKDVELVINRVYLFKINTQNAAIFGVDGIKEFVYEGDYGQEHIELEDKYANMLRMNADNHKGYIMGISQDRSKIISFHWWEVTHPDKIVKQLSKLEELIDSGAAIAGLGSEHHVRLNKALKLRGEGPIILR